MIISKCDRCWDGGGAHTLSVSSCVYERACESLSFFLSANHFLWVYVALSLCLPLSANFFRIYVHACLLPFSRPTPTSLYSFCLKLPLFYLLISSFKVWSIRPPLSFGPAISLYWSPYWHLGDISTWLMRLCKGPSPCTLSPNCPILLSPWVRVAYSEPLQAILEIYLLLSHQTHNRHTHTCVRTYTQVYSADMHAQPPYTIHPLWGTMNCTSWYVI